MKILYVASEVVPFAKTGGLADVAGALPKALSHIGHDVRIILPRYKCIDLDEFQAKLVVDSLEVQMGEGIEKVSVYETIIPDTEVTVYLVEHEEYFGSRGSLYVSQGKDYPDNLERFALFCKAALGMLKKINWQPHVIHCNDWQAALISQYLKITLKGDPFFFRTATVYSVHNMAYMGKYPKEKFAYLNLPETELGPYKLEYWGEICLAKAGLIYADVISTVSETYAKEIQTQHYGYGLEGILKKRKKDLYGILNGIDYEIWNPKTDSAIAKRYSANTISLKAQNKLKLQADNNLPWDESLPLIGIVSRLAQQKGFDFLVEIFDLLMELEVQFVILGDGEEQYHQFFKEAKKKYPKQVGVNLGFDAARAQEIYAGSDFFLMPSHYEPCGLGQLISFRYGTIPIVRKTGGLADTVQEFKPKTGEGNGFVFAHSSSRALLNTIKRALTAYKHKAAWQQLQKKVMGYDYSWDASAKKYVYVYKKALEKIGL